MGDKIYREEASVALAFTGERMTSAVSGQGDIEVEHFHRYFVAREYCREKDVLDLASGEGYGAAFLSQAARSVVGLEIAPDAVEHARHSFARDNLEYMVGDVRKIPLGDDKFDVVVSFETIEHIYEQEQFVAEVKRVLRPGGLFIVSTPERDVYSPLYSNANTFHKKELSKAEFEALLKRNFSNVGLMLQRAMNGSLLILDAQGQVSAADALTIETRGEKHFEVSEGMPRAVYVLAFASDQPVRPPSASAYIESDHISPGRVYQAEADVQQVRAQSERDANEIRARASQSVREVEENRDRALQSVQEAEENRAQALQDVEVIRARIGRVEAERAALERANQHAEEACLVLRQRSLDAQRQIAELTDRIRDQDEHITRLRKSSLRGLEKPIRSVSRVVRTLGRRIRGVRR
jgi:ubiquinone/menaquinone biosynthesis C-methylase UbiE